MCAQQIATMVKMATAFPHREVLGNRAKGCKIGFLEVFNFPA